MDNGENIEARDGHLSTGFIGTKDLMLALAKIGRNDVAYRLIHNDTFPSWWLSPSNTARRVSDSFVCIGGPDGENAVQSTDELDDGHESKGKNMMRKLFTSSCLSFFCLSIAAAALEPIRISADGKYFVLKDSGKRFTPWGFNYLGEFGTILEEYWTEKWPAIEEDFREMKKLGANVIRVHLQLPTYMAAPDQMRSEALDRLRRLLDLARDSGLYLDLTGLGLYRIKEVPPWLDALDEAGRWKAQACFWREIARACKGHPAVFCYDLMNEPVITEPKPGEPAWLAGEMEGFYFVQRIAKEMKGRTQVEIAAAWVKQMTQAIREADADALITVGVIPWAQIWPKAKPIFYAPGAAKQLDFVSAHFYPRKDKVPADLAALKVYDIGKPIVIEETFPLSCSQEEFETFITESRATAQGWISHYFGKTIAEHQKDKDLKNAVIVKFLEYWQKNAP